MEVEQRSKKPEESKHSAVIAGCSAEVKHCFGNKNQSLSRPDVFTVESRFNILPVITNKMSGPLNSA